MCGWCSSFMTWPVWLLESLRRMADSARRQTGKITRCPECETPVNQITHESESPCLGFRLLREAEHKHAPR